MFGRFLYTLLFGLALLLSLSAEAQLAMPDSVLPGATRHYYVDPNPIPGSTYSWRVNGVNQGSSVTNEIDINWTTAGTYLLEVQETTANGCPGPVRSGQVFVSVQNTLISNADLSITETVDNAMPLIGGTVIFTVTANNNLPGGATGVAVPVVLETGYTYVSSSSTNGTYDPSTSVWTIGNMNNDASEVLTLTLTVNTEGNYVNSSVISGNETDGDLSNNSAWAETFPTDFFIPEGFSPQGDGINDLFIIRGIFFFPYNSIIIYNRWGNKVYEASPYLNSWDGRSIRGLKVGGNELPSGTYFYLLDLGDGSQVIKGTVYLNR